MAETRHIVVSVDGTEARAELLTELSPRAAQALWDSLPIKTSLVPGKWSGRASFFEPPREHFADIEDLEYPVCSIYPGYFVMRPRGTEVLVAYGPSEYRWGIGTDYVTPIARIVDGYEAFIATLARMHDEGEKPLSLRREDPAAG